MGSLSELASYFFALDHTHYAQWLSVHLRDMGMIETRYTLMEQEFKNCHFAVHKTEKMFLPSLLTRHMNKTTKS